MRIQNVTAFAIEGADKVGKATQSNMLANALVDFSSLRVNSIEIPSRHHTCHTKIYDMLRRREDGSAPAFDCPAVFQTFQVANRIHVQEDIERMAQGGDVVVIFDRWVASSWAYGLAAGVGAAELRVINEGLLDPDITFMLEGKGFDRPGQGDDAYEDDDSFQGKVREAYRQWSKSKSNVIHIGADREKSVVHEEIYMHVKRCMIKKGLL